METMNMLMQVACTTRFIAGIWSARLNEYR